MDDPSPAPGLARYQRQMLLPGIGSDGQQRLRAATCLVVGCGALGCGIADALARAGVGRLILADRDVVEFTNLHRQVLFDEADARDSVPKAEAARRRLQQINRDVQVDAHVIDVNHGNIQRLAQGADVLLDGLDNYATRFLLNDVAVKHALPYIHGGAVATGGTVYPVLPHGQTPRSWRSAQLAGPCLRCLFGDAPPPGAGPTCDTAGVLGPAVGVVAAMQAAEAIKLIVHDWSAVRRTLLQIDLWPSAIRELRVASAYVAGACPCCGQGVFDYLDGRHSTTAELLCGRDAVQVPAPADHPQLDLAALADRLRPIGAVQQTRFMLRLRVDACELTLFTDGRAIVRGTTDPAVARSLYARYVGL